MTREPGPAFISLASYLLVISSNALWGISNVTVKTLLNNFPPLMLAGWRFSLGSLLFLVAVALSGHPLPRKWKELLSFGGLGLVQITLLNAFFFTALSITTVGKAAVFMNSQPLYVAVLAPYIIGETKFTALKSLGIALGFVGVLTIFAKDLIDFSRPDLLGAFLATLGTLCWTTATFWVKRLRPDCSMMSVNAVQMMVGSMPLLAAGYAFEGIERINLTAQVVALLAFLAIICTFLPYFLWYRVLRANPAGIISSFNFLAVVSSVIFGILILGEPLSLVLFVGTALVSAGIFIVNRF